MKTATDPLSYLADELDELKRQNLYRPLRVMTGPQAVHTVVDGRPVISLSSNNYLGPDDAPAPGRGSREGRARAGRGHGRGAHDRRRDRVDRGTGAAAGRLQARRGGADAAVRADGQQRRRSRPSPAEGDLIVSDELNHASIIDGVRLSKASRAVFPHRDVDGLEKVLREAAHGGRTASTATSWSSPTASSRWTATSRRWPASARSRSATRRRSWSTTRMPRACWAATAAARSTISICTAASTSRSARCRRRSA